MHANLESVLIVLQRQLTTIMTMVNNTKIFVELWLAIKSSRTKFHSKPADSAE
jgi:hypothetical protein